MADTNADASAWGAVKERAGAVLLLLRTRLELLGNELEEARLQVLRQLVLAQALLVLCSLALVLLIGAAAWYWNAHGPLVLALAGLACALGAALCAWALNRPLRTDKSPLFAASLAELQEDVRQLRAGARAHE